MTTRRRRTGSETGVEESTTTSVSAIPPTLTFSGPFQTFPHIRSSGDSLPWITSTLHPSFDAYHKKTDDVLLPPHFETPCASSQSNQGSNVVGYYKQDSLPLFQETEVFSALVNSVGEVNKSYGRNTELSGSGMSDHCDISAEQENMSARDRTQEFMNIIRSQNTSLCNGIAGHKARQSRDLCQYSEFMQRARLIGRNISSTYAKLEKLTHLARKKSLFDDNQDAEIQELTGIIRHDLNSLTKQLEHVRDQSHLATATLTGGTGHLQKHSANLLGSLQTKVASITQQFRDILEIRTQNLKKQAERRDHYAGGSVSGELPLGAVSGHQQGSVLMADEAAASNDVSIDMGEASGIVGSGVYRQQLYLIEEQDAYIQSRADTMKTIESTIVELGQMFTQLATMVKEQEELVHRIDASVEDAEVNVEAAHTELLKYFRSISSNRWLMIKVFGVLVVFFIIFILFMM